MTINMPEIFTYDFMIRAFAAGSVMAIIAPVVGLFVVVRRYSLIADTLSHVSLAGVALALLLGFSPAVGAIIASIGASIVIERLRSKGAVSGETSLALFLSGGLAVSVVLIGLARGRSADLISFLFGSISTVSTSDILTILVMGFAAVALVIAFFKELLAISFDEDNAKVSGIPVTLINTLFIIVVAVVVSLSIRIVGVLLIGALMVIPVSAAMRFKLSFTRTLLAGIIFALICVYLGIFIAFYGNVAAGGAIVLVSLLLYGIIYLLS